MPELRSLIDHARRGVYQDTDRALYLVAAMTGGSASCSRCADATWTGSRRDPGTAQPRARPLRHAKVAALDASRAGGR
jgi:hypothetical protein